MNRDKVVDFCVFVGKAHMNLLLGEGIAVLIREDFIAFDRAPTATDGTKDIANDFSVVGDGITAP